MARLDWMTFLAAHPAAHLVAVDVAGARSPTELKRLRRLMQSLIDGEHPAGDYATAIVRRRDVTEIQCGFVERTDAKRIGARLGARPVMASEGASDSWLSEQSLRLDEQAIALEDLVATPRRATRHGLADRAHPARSES